MATISNPTLNKREDEDKDKQSGIQPLGGQQSSTIAPQAAPVGPASAGVQQNKTPASGRFTNISSYMGANKQAGSQLGQALGQNVQQQIGKTTGAAQKAQTGFQNVIGQAGQEQEKIKDYTSKLSQSATPNVQEQGVLSNITGPAHLASGYQANLGQRADYAQQLAGDEKALADFLRYRSGQVAGEQQSKLDTSKTSAESATQKAQETFGQKAEQLQRDRQSLLADLIKSPNYNVGKQSLDQAFLQMDKGDTLGKLRQDIGKQQQQFNVSNMFPQLSKDYGTQRTGLTESTTGLQKQTDQNIADLQADIASRQEYMNQQRLAEQENLQKEFENLQQGKGISQEFANRLGLTQGQSLWNTLSDIPNIGNIVDMTGLNQMANSQADLANQRDIDLSAAFAKLAQTNPSLTQTSTLGDVGELNPEFTTRLTDQQKNYQDAVRNYLYGGDGSRAGAGFSAADPQLGMKNVDLSNLIDSAKSLGLTDADLQQLSGVKDVATYQQFMGGAGKDPRFQQLFNTYDQYNYAGDTPVMSKDQWYKLNAGRLGGFDQVPGGIDAAYNEYTRGVNAQNSGRNKESFQSILPVILQDLAKMGYFNQVNINPSPETISGGVKGVGV